MRCPTKNQTCSPTGWLCMRVWRMSLKRTKSAIISWDGSVNGWITAINQVLMLIYHFLEGCLPIFFLLVSCTWLFFLFFTCIVFKAPTFQHSHKQNFPYMEQWRTALSKEPEHDKTNKIKYVPSEDSDQPDQSLHCPHEEALGPWPTIESTAKTLIRLSGYPGWSESSLGMHVNLMVLSCAGSYISASVALFIKLLPHNVQ